MHDLMWCKTFLVKALVLGLTNIPGLFSAFCLDRKNVTSTSVFQAWINGTPKLVNILFVYPSSELSTQSRNFIGTVNLVIHGRCPSSVCAIHSLSGTAPGTARVAIESITVFALSNVGLYRNGQRVRRIPEWRLVPSRSVLFGAPCNVIQPCWVATRGSRRVAQPWMTRTGNAVQALTTCRPQKFIRVSIRSAILCAGSRSCSMVQSAP